MQISTCLWPSQCSSWNIIPFSSKAWASLSTWAVGIGFLPSLIRVSNLAISPRWYTKSPPRVETEVSRTSFPIRRVTQPHDGFFMRYATGRPCRNRRLRVRPFLFSCGPNISLFGGDDAGRVPLPRQTELRAGALPGMKWRACQCR